jgi:hypothetical protein
LSSGEFSFKDYTLKAEAEPPFGKLRASRTPKLERPASEGGPNKGKKTHEHSQESSRKRRVMGRRWLCHKEGDHVRWSLRVVRLSMRFKLGVKPMPGVQGTWMVPWGVTVTSGVMMSRSQ